jgi:uncharacterized protein YyaL (SSP411 family)
MTDKRDRKKANRLLGESSPYLLQHAYNPVDWRPFSPQAFSEAKQKNLPVLISIGYSACHWCHVMERECFEDGETAEFMNANFVSIKVDREERPDVDMLYMQAVQLMTGHGGWPLNCFVLPDGRPFYGGTYFPREKWKSILKQLAQLYKSDFRKVEDYADALLEGIEQSEIIQIEKRNGERVNAELLRQSLDSWKKSLDNTHGGSDKAPKFPLPSNYLFLLRYAIQERDDALKEHVELTLRKMANGGIYDQVHGGFARYSTDLEWKVPHFEKMLYDNAQLASLYAEAWRLTKNPLYRRIACETLDFAEREWFDADGFFYSAFDADSEGQEGKYYVWTKEELETTLGEDYPLFAACYEINERGYWEDGNYILMRAGNDAAAATAYGLSGDELEAATVRMKEKLRAAAKLRVKPALDDKSICSWNSMMCSAFAKAYLSFGIPRYREIALRCMDFTLERRTNERDRLRRDFSKGKARIEGFLDDYAFSIAALIDCYLVSKSETYLKKAKAWCEFALDNFAIPGSEYLYYSGQHAEKLVARTIEMQDNVIPSSNAVMALNLFYLGKYLDRTEWVARAGRMLEQRADTIKKYGSAASHWGCLSLHFIQPFREIAIVGKNVDELFAAIYRHGVSNAIFAIGENESDMPLMKGRFSEGKTLIYVCENFVCKAPVESAEAALSQLNEIS